MISRLHPVIFLSLAIAFAQCKSPKKDVSAKKENNYSIDKSIKDRTGKLSGLGSAIMDVTLLNNGNEMPIASSRNQPAMSVYNDTKDTVKITVMPWLVQGMGVSIYLFNDTAIVRHFVSPRDREPSFKHNAGDTTYTSTLEVNPVSSKLVLSEPYMPGKPIQGYFEIESEEYYQKNWKGPDTKRVYKAKGYFNANKF